MRSMIVFLAATYVLSAADYYVDSAKGADSSIGTSARQPWKSLEKVNAAVFAPGDRVLFKNGSVWHGQLAPGSSGAPGAPLVIDRYGRGMRPRIDGAVRWRTLYGCTTYSTSNSGDWKSLTGARRPRSGAACMCSWIISEPRPTS